MLLGLLTVLADRRLVQVGLDNWIRGTDVTLWHIACALILLGLVLLLAFYLWPSAPRTASVPGPPELDAIPARRRLAAVRRWSALGWATVFAGALVAGYFLIQSSPETGLRGVLLAAPLVLSGSAIALYAAARRPVLQRLVARLTLEPPTGALDPRVPPVLRCLDDLLGQLDPKDVAGFLTRPEAKLYLELMAEVNELGPLDPPAEDMEDWPEPAPETDPEPAPETADGEPEDAEPGGQPVQEDARG